MENKNRKSRQSPASGSGGKSGRKTGAGAKSGRTAAGTGKKPAKKGAGKKNKKEGKKGGNLLTTLIMILAFGILAVSIYQIVKMVLPYYSGGKEYDKVKEMAVTEPDPEEEEEGESPGDGFQVNFEALLAENPDTVAWIRMEEPAIISYPVVKSRDNEEYLTKTFSANDNKLGAIFLDKRSHSSFTDKNSFIYGHNLKVGGEMFSQLSAYADEAFCQQHPYFYIYTPDGMTKVYQVFSAGVVKATAENYNLNYNTDEDFLDYLELCRKSSNYQVDVDLNAGSRIVSLSTCTNVLEDERFLLQGVLIEEH